MCVRIYKDNQMFGYDPTLPLMDQIKGADEVIVNYLEKDDSVHKFLDAVEEASKTAFGLGLNIRVIHNNLLMGAKAKANMVNASKNMTLNDIIQIMALSHHEADKKLSEMVKICKGKHCDE